MQELRTRFATFAIAIILMSSLEISECARVLDLSKSSSSTNPAFYASEESQSFSPENLAQVGLLTEEDVLAELSKSRAADDQISYHGYGNESFCYKEGFVPDFDAVKEFPKFRFHVISPD
jgi:hypothetical protein